MTSKDRTAHEAFHADRVREALKGTHPVYTRTEYTRGMTDYVRVYVATRDRRIEDISYPVAAAAGLKMTDRGIKFGGGQYNKGLEAFEWACKVSGIRPDQSRWEEIH